MSRIFRAIPIISVIWLIAITGMAAETKQPGDSIGIDLVKVSPITDNWLLSVAWSGERFVAVGERGTLIYSEDGTAWDSLFCSLPLNFYDIIWTGNEFIALAHDNQFPWPSIVRSSDGYYWKNASKIPFSSEGMYGVAFSGSRFIAVGHGGQIFSSEDGDTWVVNVEPTSERTVNFYSVIWADSCFLAAGERWDPETSRWSGLVAHSRDGSQWTYASVTGTSLLFDMVKHDGKVVAVGYIGPWGEGEAVIASSEDMLSWDVTEFTEANYLRTAATVGSIIVAGGDDGFILISTDGRTWKRLMYDGHETFSGIAANRQSAVLVGSSGTVIVIRMEPAYLSPG